MRSVIFWNRAWRNSNYLLNGKLDSDIFNYLLIASRESKEAVLNRVGPVVRELAGWIRVIKEQNLVVAEAVEIVEVNRSKMLKLDLDYNVMMKMLERIDGEIGDCMKEIVNYGSESSVEE